MLRQRIRYLVESRIERDDRALLYLILALLTANLLATVLTVR